MPSCLHPLRSSHRWLHWLLQPAVFSPPEIAPLVRADSNSDLIAKYTARSNLLDNADLIADRQILFGTDLPPAFPQRDIPAPPPMPPPPLLPPPMILPRMLQPRMRTRGHQ
ncbi:hypothetical protein ANCDUO_24912 [Ancylostoma duodenale]|uniref:Uncharacterized protein n=1 Tax=Ancylostoma duodenale TaxID=51022 RepID=A0A0C2BML8_9BILA|nr:hypothetical protein ANCDUO_24912 [Ancylostoma duodenale]